MSWFNGEHGFRLLSRIAEALERQADTGEKLLALSEKQYAEQAARMEAMAKTSRALELNLMESTDDCRTS